MLLSRLRIEIKRCCAAKGQVSISSPRVMHCMPSAPSTSMSVGLSTRLSHLLPTPALTMFRAFCLIRSKLHSCHRIHCKFSKMAAEAKPGNFESQLKDGWFTEKSSLWPGQGMSLKIDQVHFKGRSDFQVRN